jgi:hypothetical protein
LKEASDTLHTGFSLIELFILVPADSLNKFLFVITAYGRLIFLGENYADLIAGGGFSLDPTFWVTAWDTSRQGKLLRILLKY